MQPGGYYPAVPIIYSRAAGGGSSAAVKLTSAQRPLGMTFTKMPTAGQNGEMQIANHGEILDSANPDPFSSTVGVFKESTGSPWQIIAHGDSLTFGTGCKEPSTPRLVRAVAVAKSQAFDFKKAGTPGIGFDYTYTVGYSMNSEAAVTVDAARSGSATNRLIIWGGTNDVFLNNYTPAQLRTAFQTYISNRLAFGWAPQELIVIDMLPRQTYSESNRTTINGNFLTDKGTYGYTLVRASQDPNIGAAGQQNNTTWFVDQIHLTDLGQARLATLIQAAAFP